MVRIQLETGYLDVKEGTNFPLNFGVADVRDLSKRSGTFSKTITLVGNDNNNILLNNYYDVNIEAGTFDIDVLTPCTVLQNDVPIVEDAYLQLVSVNKVQKNDGYEEEVEYLVLVKDAQADFFTKLDNSELTDIDFTDLNHTYNSTNVVTSFSHTVTDGYVYPLCANPSNVYPLNSFFPAIYAKQYFDRIHSTNGFSYEWTDLQNFDKAVVLYNGDKPATDYSDYLVEFNKASFTPTLGAIITSWTETQDDQGLFNPTTGVYTPPFYVATGQSINYQVSLECDVDLDNATGANAYLVDITGSGFAYSIRYVAKVIVKKNGVDYVTQTIGSPVLYDWANTDNPLPNGTNTIGTINATINVPVSNVLPTDSITFALEIEQVATGVPLPYLKWKDTAVPSGNDVTITDELNVTSMAVSANLAVNVLGFGQTIDMNVFIPKKVKQKDFIKWILFRWNMYVELDPDNPNKFVYKTRDSYYDDGTEKDWTLKLAKDRTQELQFLPELSSKKLILSDKSDSDDYNKAYLDAFNEVYGQVEFTYDNEYVKGTERKETIFSPTPMIKTTFGAVVPSINGASPKNNIRLLLHNGTTTCEAFDIIDYGTTGTTETDYPIVHHFDDPFNPTFDLNFGVCDYYFYDGITLTNNNMYNLFWRRTIAQINSGKMLTAYFDLRESDIQTLALSDKIRINNSWWNINRVIDYNANKKQLTKVELLSVDDEITLPPFRTKIIKVTTPETGLDPFPDLASKFYDDSNINYSPGSTTIKGINNIVLPGIKAYVIGDGGVIDSDGFWVDGEKISNPDSTVSKTYNVTIVGVDYTALGDFDEIIEASASGITITLPDPRDWEGKKFYVKNYGGGNIDITTTAITIDGSATITIADLDSVTIASDGLKYIII